MSKKKLKAVIDDRDLPGLKKLVEGGVDLNDRFSDGRTPLFESVSWPKGLEHMLKHGAEVDARVGDDGSTALMLAIQRGELKSTTLLLEAGADVNLEENGCAITAMWYACGHSNKTGEKMVSMLLEKGADIHSYHALSRAAGYGSPALIHLLLEAGADVNHTEPIYICPLYMAIFNGKKKHVEILLDAGADPSVKVFGDRQADELIGMDLVEFARHMGQNPIAKLLERALEAGD